MLSNLRAIEQAKLSAWLTEKLIGVAFAAATKYHVTSDRRYARYLPQATAQEWEFATAVALSAGGKLVECEDEAGVRELVSSRLTYAEGGKIFAASLLSARSGRSRTCALCSPRPGAGRSG